MKLKIILALVAWALLEVYAPYRLEHIKDLYLINKSYEDAVAKGSTKEEALFISNMVRESLGR